MDGERDYLVGSGLNVQNAYGLDAAKSVSLNAEAASALNEAYTLHSQLDELESRLFGPTPRAIAPGNAAGSDAAPPPILANAIKNTRQRVDSANSRLSSILGRL